MTWFNDAEKILQQWESRQQVETEFWEAFTPRVRKAIGLGVEQANQMNHNFIGTEHLLLGLLRLGQGVAVNVLKKCGLSIEAVRREILRQTGRGPEQNTPKLTSLNPRARNVLNVAKNEAKALGHTYAGTEHLLLGLLTETDGTAWRIFKMAGIDFEKMRQEVLAELNSTTIPPTIEIKGGP